MNAKLQVANIYLNDRLFANAKELYQDVYTTEQDPEALFGLALCAYVENDFTLALDYLNGLLQLNPNHAGAFNQIGIIYAIMGDMESAKAMFIAAININPDFVDAQRNYGEILLTQEDYINGVKTFVQIIKNHPNNIPTLVRMAQLYEEAGRSEDAEQLVDRILELDPGNKIGRSLWNENQKRVVVMANLKR